MESLERDPLFTAQQRLPYSLELPPFAPEDSTRFLKENFHPRTLDDIAEYGKFMIALMVWCVGDTRGSFMPTTRDFDDMYHAGYGVSSRQLPPYGTERRPGVRRVQRRLDFYPDGFRPEKARLLKDLKGLAQHSLRPSVDFDPTTTDIEQILSWAWARDLLPSRNILYDVLTDMTEVRRTFSIEKLPVVSKLTFADVYRFGARVLRENDGPLTRDQMDEKYHDVFEDKPTTIIKAFFGTYRQFWLEFDLVVHSRGMTEQENINLGIRHAIATGDARISHSKAKYLEKHNKLCVHPIEEIGFVTYQKMVDAGYDAYLQLRDRLLMQGITAEVVQAACQKFEYTPEFEMWLEQNGQALQKLSNGSAEATRLLKRVQSGFDLKNKVEYDRQLATAYEDMQTLGMAGWQKRFIFDLTPRVSSREALALEPISDKSGTEGLAPLNKGERFDLTNWGVQIVIRDGQRVVKVRRRGAFNAPPWATDVIERVFDEGVSFSHDLLELARLKEPRLQTGDLYQMLDAFKKFLRQSTPSLDWHWRDRPVRTLSGRRRLLQARRQANIGEFLEPKERYWE